ncbi:cell division suppressor protein YneA [Metabacillus fastidiosus]|uniref:cell division suppressor protein YneA n=1 Tax=Metabacillus fastidiosus TaxID=1458 RepID=UPI003D2DCD6A
MKTESFAYILSFFFVIIAIVFALSYTGIKESKDHYYIVTIEEGDSLWSIADKFQEQANLSTWEFITWVQEKNNLYTEVIKPGDEVMIPVKKDLNNLASKE